MTQSQNAEIVKYLKEGNTITSLEAWVKFGCSALHSRLSDLRNRMNIEVADRWVKVQTARGEKRVKQYFLSNCK
jgi:hypothetical protein